MKTLLRSFVCFVCFAGLSATAHAQKNVQKSDATATRDEITADLKFGTGKTGTFLTGSALTLNSGSTLTLNGALAGTPTGGTLSLANLTLTLGTPAALTLTNATGLPIATGVSGLGTGVATFLATPSSANLAAAVTGETGSGALVFGTSPTLTTPVIASIVNTGTLTLPTATDTLIGRATTDTLTNKSISGATNTFSAIPNSALGNASLTIGSTNIALGGTSTTLAGLSSLTGATDLTLSGGSSGASLVLGATTSGVATINTLLGSVKFNTEATTTLQLSGTSTGNTLLSGNTALSGGKVMTLQGSAVTFELSGLGEAGRFAATTGNLLIGTTSETGLSGAGNLKTAGDVYVASSSTATAVNTGGLRSANFGLSTVSGGASYFGGLVATGGRIGINAAPVGYAGAYLGGIMPNVGGDTTGAGYFSSGTFPASFTGGAHSFYSLPASTASAYTVANMSGFYAGAPTKGAGSTITNLYGVYVEALTQGVNNYAFYSAGATPSYFGGAATFAGAVTHTLGTNYPPQTAPASPASGWVLYTDSGDGNKLKAKASTGTVVTIGTP